MRAAAIFALGLAGTVTVLVTIFNLRLVSLLLAGALVLMVAAGFALRPRTEFLTMISPPTDEGHTGIGANLPSWDSFRVELKNLPLLFVPTFAAVAYCVWLLSRWQKGAAEPEIGGPFFTIYYVATYIGVALLLLAGVWLGERVLLSRGLVAMACIHADASEPQRYRYEFFDHKGVRYAEVRQRHFWDDHFAGSTAPVVFNRRRPAHSKPGFAFAFHRFALLGRRSTPVRAAEAVHPTG